MIASTQTADIVPLLDMNQTPVILRWPHICEITKLPKTSIYEMLNPNSKYYCATFPKPVKISARCVGFVEAEVLAWIKARMDERIEKK